LANGIGATPYIPSGRLKGSPKSSTGIVLMKAIMFEILSPANLDQLQAAAWHEHRGFRIAVVDGES
jgi:hypothetical protein